MYWKSARQLGLVVVTALAITTASTSNANAQAVAAATVGGGLLGAFVAIVTSPVILGVATIVAAGAAVAAVMDD